MTSKIIVNTIEGDVGVSSVTFNDTIYGNLEGNVTGNVTGQISGIQTSISTNNLTVNGNAYPSAGPLSNRNLIINGSMLVDQRNGGASASPTGTYGFQLDRYAVWYSTGSGHTVQQVEDAPTSFQYSWKFTTGTGATPTGSDYGRLYYPVEGYDANVLELGTANQQAFTFSFYVKISVAGTYGVQFADSLTTTKYQTSFSIAANEVGTWVRRVITVPAGTIVNGTYSASNALSFVIAFDLGEGPTRSVAAGYQTGASSSAYGLTGGTKIMATSGATYQLTGIQLEVGTVATPFEHRSYGDELARCQRYYQYIGTLTLHTWSHQIADTGGMRIQQWTFPGGRMRATPTATYYDASSGGNLNKWAVEDPDRLATNTNVSISMQHNNYMSSGGFKYPGAVANFSLGQSGVAVAYRMELSAEL